MDSDLDSKAAKMFGIWRRDYHTKLDPEGYQAANSAYSLGLTVGADNAKTQAARDSYRNDPALQAMLPPPVVAYEEPPLLEKPTEDPHDVARIVIDRLRQVVKFIGDPQHPRWHAENRKPLDDILHIVDPPRPELDDDAVMEDDELWNTVYMTDPVDAYVSQAEKYAFDKLKLLEGTPTQFLDHQLLGSTADLIDRMVNEAEWDAGSQRLVQEAIKFRKVLRFEAAQLKARAEGMGK